MGDNALALAHHHAAELGRECRELAGELAAAKRLIADIRAALVSGPLDPPTIAADTPDEWRAIFCEVAEARLWCESRYRIERTHKPQTEAWAVVPLGEREP